MLLASFNNSTLWTWLGTVMLSVLLVTAFWLWVASLPYRRLGVEAHWTERARQWTSYRKAVQVTVIWIVMLMAILQWGGNGRRMEAVLLVALAAWLGSMLGARLACRGMRLPEALRQGGLLGSWVFWLAFFPGIPLILGLLAFTLGRALDAWTLGITGGVLVLTALWLMGINMRVLRLMGLLRPVPEPIQRLVDELAGESGTYVSHVSVIRLPLVNAFAWVWSNEIVFTQSLLEALSEVEMRGIIAHELEHLREPPSARWTRLSGLLAAGALSLTPAAANSFGPAGFAACFVIYILIAKVIRRFSLRAEAQADASAVSHDQTEGAYARALEKVHEAGLLPAVLNRNSLHPHLYDRLIKAGMTPDYPRPQPPALAWPLLIGLLASGSVWYLSTPLYFLARKALHAIH